MKSTILLFLISFLHLTHAWSHHKPCLTDSSATSLLASWYALFSATDPTSFDSITSAILTNDFSYEDETLNFAVGPCVISPEGPIATSREFFVDVLTERLKESSTVGDKYEVLDFVVGCDKIAARNQGIASTKGNIPNITAAAGESVRWKGIDLLTIDVSAMKIKKVVSSSDWFKHAYDTGIPIVFQKYHFPTCLCQTPNLSLNSDGECVAPPSTGT